MGSLEAQLDISIEQMRNDPAWMCWAPTDEEWSKLSVGTRTGVVMLYETVYQKMLLRRAGLGYVGLPLAVTFAENGFQVIGFDINKEKIEKYLDEI